MLATSTFAGTRSQVAYEGVLYHTYRCKPDEVQVFWKDDKGKPYGNFANLQAALAQRGKRLLFAMNGGIFEPDSAPSGLHVEEARELHPLNRAPGKGNFFLKPNGVFFIDTHGAHIWETGEFAHSGVRPRVAVQSGPLLLRNDRIHPAFRADSQSRLHRNGVGVTKDGDVIFAITEFDRNNQVNLYGFAEFFRSQGCRDALFLDGDISLMWTPEDGAPRPVNSFGAILGITEMAKD